MSTEEELSLTNDTALIAPYEQGVATLLSFRPPKSTRPVFASLKSPELDRLEI